VVTTHIPEDAFHGNTTTHLMSGQTKQIAEIKLGDRVLTNSEAGSYSPISFLNLRMAQGPVLTL
jgi:hypothetical protein